MEYKGEEHLEFEDIISSLDITTTTTTTRAIVTITDREQELGTSLKNTIKSNNIKTTTTLVENSTPTGHYHFHQTNRHHLPSNHNKSTQPLPNNALHSQHPRPKGPRPPRIPERRLQHLLRRGHLLNQLIPQTISRHPPRIRRFHLLNLIIHEARSHSGLDGRQEGRP